MSLEVGQADVQQLLLDGGYYRARIASITSFDLAAGGLAWCILNSRHSIDVDFVEEANIGHKIKVAENICKALKDDMVCPHDLRPHQIQGLDWPKLYPVLQWLLVRVQAAREEYASILYQFVQLDNERRFDVRSVPRKTAKQSTAPRRQFRAAPSGAALSRLEHVNSVLLEYGHKYTTGAASSSAAAQVDGEPVDDDVRRQLEEERQDAAAMEKLLVGMSAFKDKQKLSGAAVGSIMSTQGDIIAAQRAAFEEKMRQLEERRRDISTQKNRIGDLQQEVVTAQSAVEALKATVDSTQNDRIAPLQKDVNKKQRKITKVLNGIAEEWATIEADPEKHALAKQIMSLLEDKAKLEGKLEADGENYGSHLLSLKGTIAELKADYEVARNAPSGQLEELDVATESLMAMHNAVATSAHEAGRLARELDQLPSKSELLQYERRHNELVAEVDWKYLETQRCYAHYNALSEKATNIRKEVALMQNVLENFETLNATKSTRLQHDELVSNIDGVVATIVEAASKQEARLKSETEEFEALSASYNALLGRQRAYFTMLKNLQEAVERNGELMGHGGTTDIL